MRKRGPTSRLSRRPLSLFVVAGLVGTMAIGGGSLFASERAGEAEAIDQVRTRTLIVASTVVEPNLSIQLLNGDQNAIDQLDAIVTERVLDDTTLRVKLWDAGGRIVYSDEPGLIGEVYELGPDKTASLASGQVVAEISDLSGPENRFEAELADQMLEVYLPLRGPDGMALLYESYFDSSGVAASASRIRSEFTPIILSALVLMEALHLGLAAWLSRRLRRNQADQERLLQRAIEASDLERRRIAADLHDGVVQEMTGTSLAVSAAAASASHLGPSLESDLRKAAIASRRSLQSLRSLLVDIYPPNLHDQGIYAALTDLLAPAANLGIEVTLTSANDLAPSSDATTALAYRVIQESVRNVFRHAEATKLDVTLDVSPTLVVATISDNGIGFFPDSASRSGHLGLSLLGDLTKDAGATFTVRSTPGAGTDIRVEVPQ